MRDLLMRPAIHISRNMQPVPMKGRSVTYVVNYVKGQGLALSNLKNRTEVVVIYPESRALCTCAKVMRRWVQRQRNTLFDPICKVRHWN